MSLETNNYTSFAVCFATADNLEFCAPHLFLYHCSEQRPFQLVTVSNLMNLDKGLGFGLTLWL